MLQEPVSGVLASLAVSCILGCEASTEAIKLVPSVGKSSLMSGLTGVESIAAAYEVSFFP